MIYFISVLVSFLVNDARILNRIFGNYLEFIKYKVVSQELGISIFISCLAVNFLKGYIFFYSDVTSNSFLLLICLLIGNYLGAKPGNTGGSEIMMLWGVWAGCNFDLVQLPLALLISWWLITKKFSQAILIGSYTGCLIVFANVDYLLGLLSFICMVNYTFNYQSLFITFDNKIKEIII